MRHRWIGPRAVLRAASWAIARQQRADRGERLALDEDVAGGGFACTGRSIGVHPATEQFQLVGLQRGLHCKITFMPVSRCGRRHLEPRSGTT